MLPQRVLRIASRRLAFEPAARPQIASRANALAPILHRDSRPSTTQSADQSDHNDILAKQRLNRPVSPHLSIYRPQITWYSSALNRITGSALSGGLYVFALAYLVAPAFGWHLESAVLAASFGALPAALKVAIKSFVALPFTFHSFNGLRHLVWDVGVGFANKTVMRSGWAVVGLSVASALGLAFV